MMKTLGMIILFSLVASSLFAQSTIRRNIKTKEVLLHVDYKKTNEPNMKEEKNQKKEVIGVDSIKQSENVDISLPLKRKGHITSNYGMRLHPIENEYKFHSGVDLRARQDTIYSVFSGKVSESGYSKGLGYYVKVQFKDYSFIYGHLSEYYVLEGETIKAGLPIGLSGNTGKSTAEHLHFTIKKGNNYINPELLINYLNNKYYDRIEN